MVDITSEQVLTLSECTKVVPRLNGKRIHPSTLWRWVRHGVRGVRLEHARVGNRIVTTKAAIARFAQRLAEADDAPRPTEHRSNSSVGPKHRTDHQRQQNIARATKELEQAGIK